MFEQLTDRSVVTLVLHSQIAVYDVK